MLNILLQRFGKCCQGNSQELALEWHAGNLGDTRPEKRVSNCSMGDEGKFGLVCKLYYCELIVYPTIAHYFQRQAMFDSSDFNKLVDHVDAFSLMSYDYSPHGRYANLRTAVKHHSLSILHLLFTCPSLHAHPLSLSLSFWLDACSPGANSPIDWVEENVVSLCPTASPARQKLLLGLNFYGYDFTGSDMNRKIISQFYLSNEHAVSLVIPPPLIGFLFTILACLVLSFYSFVCFPLSPSGFLSTLSHPPPLIPLPPSSTILYLPPPPPPPPPPPLHYSTRSSNRTTVCESSRVTQTQAAVGLTLC